MNKILFYPAIFHKEPEGGYWISFPDIPECFSQGKDMEEAYSMATEALGLALTDGENLLDNLPIPSKIEDIKVDDGIIVLVSFNYLEYVKKYCNKAVKKTLSIPKWLNEAAIREGINFSQVLQEALIQRLI